MSAAVVEHPITPEISDDGHTMQCMEVWGGNEAADSTMRMPGLDAWVYSRPYKGDAGGGDVHYLSRCGTGRIARLLVADVSGHGAAVNDIAINLRTLMRRFVNFLDQTQFVESLNREFAGLTDSGLFATAVVGTYWAPTQYLVTCNAGHPPPFRYRARTKSWDLLEPMTDSKAGDLANLPLGIFDPTRYDQFGVRLERDDLVLIYTDSLMEAGATDGEMLGTAGLLRILSALDASKPETLIPKLIAKVHEHAGTENLGDDATALLMRNTAKGAPKMNFRETANAVWLFLGLVVARIGGGSTPIPWPELRSANILGPIFGRFNLRWGSTEGKVG